MLDYSLTPLMFFKMTNERDYGIYFMGVMPNQVLIVLVGSEPNFSIFRVVPSVSTFKTDNSFNNLIIGLNFA